MNKLSKKSTFSLNEMIKNNNFMSFLVGVYVFIWFTQIGKRVGILGDIRFEFLLGFVLTITSILLLSQKPKIKSYSSVGKIAFFMIIFYGIFAIFSYDQKTSWDIYFNRVIKFSLLSLFIYVIVDNIHKLAFILFCYFLAALKTAQEGFIGWLTGSMIWENQGIPRLHGSINMYAHPNSFSGFGVSLLPFIYCFYPLVNKYLKLALIFLLVGAIVIIVFTGSRTGYIATSIFILYVLIKNLRENLVKFFIIAAPLIVSTIFLLPEEYKGRFSTIFSQEDQEGGSTVARKQIIFDAFDIFLHRPMGVGIGAFPKIRSDMFGRSQDTHNLYLEILTNTGFIGLIIFFIFIYHLLKANQKIGLIHANSHTHESRILVALSSAVVGFIWARLFLGLFGMDMYEIYWWLALGLTLSNVYISSRYIDASKSNFK